MTGIFYGQKNTVIAYLLSNVHCLYLGTNREYLKQKNRSAHDNAHGNQQKQISSLRPELACYLSH